MLLSKTLLVDAINCYNCEINEGVNQDTCMGFNTDTPKQNCQKQNYCTSSYGKRGEYAVEIYSCDSSQDTRLKGSFPK